MYNNLYMLIMNLDYESALPEIDKLFESFNIMCYPVVGSIICTKLNSAFKVQNWVIKID